MIGFSCYRVDSSTLDLILHYAHPDTWELFSIWFETIVSCFICMLKESLLPYSSLYTLLCSCLWDPLDLKKGFTIFDSLKVAMEMHSHSIWYEVSSIFPHFLYMCIWYTNSMHGRCPYPVIRADEQLLIWLGFYSYF